MATYRLNEALPGARNVEADFFKTEGDFVDFYEYRNGENQIVLRVRANWLQSAELIK